MRTRPAALAAAALLIAVLPTLPAVSPAQAADPPGSTEVAVIATSDGELLQQASPDGPRTPFGDDRGGDRYELAISRDGSRVIDNEEPVYPPSVIVRDIGGATAASYTDFEDGVLQGATLAPDGNRIAYGDEGLSEDYRPGIQVQDISGPLSQQLSLAGPAYLSESEFLAQDLLLVRDAVSRTAVPRFRVLGLGGAANRAVVGLTGTAASALTAFSLDPGGSRMTYVRTLNGVRSVEVVTMTVSATQVVFGSPRVLVSGSVAAPAFTRDGATVVYVSGIDGSRDLWSVPAAGGTATAYGPATPGVDEEAVVFGVKESTAPGAAVLGRPVLNGTNVSIPVTVANDPTVSRLHVIRTSVGQAPDEGDRRLPTTAFQEFGLALGRTYTYALQVVDRSGNVGPVVTTQLVATAPPSMATADPTSGTSAVSGFPVQLAVPGNAADTRYTVDQHVQGASAWTRLVTSTTAGSTSSRGTPGQTYAFRGAAVDRFGNQTVVEPGIRAVVPFDQQRATYTGRVITAKRQGAYGTTVTFLAAAGATATFRSAGDRVQLVGERCPTCGSFDVFLDGVRKARVDTHSSTRAVRQVLWTSSRQYTNKVRTMTVRAVRPGVVVDAVAARRYGTDKRTSLEAGHQLLIGQGLKALKPNRYGYRPGFDFNGSLYLSKGGYTPTGTWLVMQVDGNLVIYDGTRAVWSSGTGGNGPSTLVQQDDGNLVVYRDRDGVPRWSAARGRL